MLVLVAARQQHAVALQIGLVQADARRAAFGKRTRPGAQREDRAQAGVEIALAESFPERGESRLAGAVSRRDVADLVRVAQVRSDLVDLVVLGDDQMQTAGDETRSEERRVGKECRSRW